jgi:ATP-dependent Lon protease
MDEEMEERTKEPGVAIGLAGRRRAASAVHRGVADGGTGSLTLTGQLGEVMKESARAALSWFRAHASATARPGLLQERRDSPARAVGRDSEGRPSAGVTIATALASELTRGPFAATSR